MHEGVREALELGGLPQGKVRETQVSKSLS
jgi:hypothetical protein